ncbi:hypothetical protein V6N13_128283 [Hibiscus sabdariffa]
MDPEADLSSLAYIDEKLQHVLGHLQKDFEGGVSAENLGAKFGGYGSFLPTYSRSPSWPHPKSPPSQSCNASRSPKNMALESRKAGPPPITFGTLPALKASSANDSIEQGINITPADAYELASSRESANKNDESPSGSEGMYRETRELLFESPTSILKFMTSFPLAACSTGCPQ